MTEDQDEMLAWSTDRRVSLARGLFRVGPGGALEERFAVRWRIQDDGTAGGCDLAKSLDEATAEFLKLCGAP